MLRREQKAMGEAAKGRCGRAVIEPMEGRVLMTVTMTDVIVSSYSTGAGAAGEPGVVEASYRSRHPGGLNVCLGDGSVR